MVRLVQSATILSLFGTFVYGLDHSHYLLQFEEWTQLHGKSYENAEEYTKRHEIFLANAQIVQRHNQAYESGHTLYAMTLKSPFADLTNEEFAASYLMESQNCSATHKSSGKLRSEEEQIIKLPKFVDWRTRGVITPIKNQKHVSRVHLIPGNV